MVSGEFSSAGDTFNYRRVMAIGAIYPLGGYDSHLLGSVDEALLNVLNRSVNEALLNVKRDHTLCFNNFMAPP